MVPGRPYGLRNEALLILREAKKDVSQIGGGKLAGSIVDGIQTAVAKAMDDAKREIAGATTELVGEIRDGGQAVKRAIQAEVMNVRNEFGKIVGNAEQAATDAVTEAKAAADAAKEQG